MAYTVEAAFNTFYDSINLAGDYREIANARRDRIVSLLGNHFEILDAFSTGSIPKFTALKQVADLDVMVVLHYSKHIKDKSPTVVLQNVQNALSEYRTGARKNGQAVTLYYETWPNVDIVPVSRSADIAGNVTHYNVPNSNTGGWIESRPKEFAATIEARSSKCGSNFRRIIKMIKHWNAIHSGYLQSYHIEVLALKTLDSNLDDTAWNILQFFSKARPLLNVPLWYDRGYADDYLSTVDRWEVQKRFDTAIERSRLAWHHTYDSNNDHASAIRLWKQVFGDKFPAYG
jgi:SMODS domain-containing protein